MSAKEILRDKPAGCGSELSFSGRTLPVLLGLFGD